MLPNGVGTNDDIGRFTHFLLAIQTFGPNLVKIPMRKLLPQVIVVFPVIPLGLGLVDFCHAQDQPFLGSCCGVVRFPANLPSPSRAVGLCWPRSWPCPDCVEE